MKHYRCWTCREKSKFSPHTTLFCVILILIRCEISYYYNIVRYLWTTMKNLHFKEDKIENIHIKIVNKSYYVSNKSIHFFHSHHFDSQWYCWSVKNPGETKVSLISFEPAAAISISKIFTTKLTCVLFHSKYNQILDRGSKYGDGFTIKRHQKTVKVNK